MVIGLDVGGVATKGALIGEDGSLRRASRDFDVWREPARLTSVVAEVLAELDPDASASVALTMTAELSDAFATKRDGVAAVLDAVAGPRPVRVYTVDGGWLSVERARSAPREVAASNWRATAQLVARSVDDALLVDVGSTTTDVIPVRGGAVAARGRTDLERLLAGELLYTGAVRTNAAAIAPTVPVRGADCPVSSELFALSGDAHVLLGHLRAEDCGGRWPDGRGGTPRECRARLARLVCSDAEELPDAEIDAIAAHLHARQVAAIAAALARAGGGPVVPLGLGAFLARAAAAAAGLDVREPDGVLADGTIAAPAVALSILGADA